MNKYVKFFEDFNKLDNYEFHLSTEPNLKEGLPFSKQHRTVSFYGERGNMGADNDDVIFTTDSPEAWYDQFKMELGEDAPDVIPKYLYLVKVKHPSEGGYLSQSLNDPKDVIVIKKIPNNIDGEPNFNLAYQMKNNI